MLGWLNQELLSLEFKSEFAKILSLIGYKYMHLPLVIREALKDPKSFLSKELAVCQFYFELREEVRKLEAAQLFMQLFFAKLVEEMEYLIVLLEKKIASLHDIAATSIINEVKVKVEKEIIDKELLLIELKKTLDELSKLYKHKEQKLEQLKQVKETLEIVVIQRSQNVINHIDYLNEVLDQKAMKIISEEKDPRKQAQMYQTLQVIQADRKLAKQRVAKIPDILRKSGLDIEEKDQMLKKAVCGQLEFVKATKGFEKYELQSKNDLHEVRESLDKVVKSEDRKIKEAQGQVKEIQKEIKETDTQINQNSEKIVDLKSRLNLPDESHQVAPSMEVATFKQKTSDILNVINEFYYLHKEYFLVEEKASDLLFSVIDELTSLLNNDTLPASQRFTMVTALVKDMSSRKGSISINPAFTQLFQTLTGNLEPRITHTP